MTNNDKMSLVQWTELIPYFTTVVLCFLILLLWITKQSKAPAERQTTVKSRNKQTECCYDCTVPILTNYFHITHTQTSFCGYRFVKSSNQYLYFNIISKWRHANGNIQVCKSKYKETKAQNIHLTPCRQNQKHFWALGPSDVPWPQPKLAPGHEQRTALYLAFNEEKT